MLVWNGPEEAPRPPRHGFGTFGSGRRRRPPAPLAPGAIRSGGGPSHRRRRLAVSLPLPAGRHGQRTRSRGVPARTPGPARDADRRHAARGGVPRTPVVGGSEPGHAPRGLLLRTRGL